MPKKTKSIVTMAKALRSDDKRNSIRFEPDPGTIAWIDASGRTTKSAFKPIHVALVQEESFRGCGLICRMTTELAEGSFVLVKVGNNPVLKAEVRWRVDLDSQAIRIGLMYLE